MSQVFGLVEASHILWIGQERLPERNGSYTESRGERWSRRKTGQEQAQNSLDGDTVTVEGRRNPSVLETLKEIQCGERVGFDTEM